MTSRARLLAVAAAALVCSAPASAAARVRVVRSQPSVSAKRLSAPAHRVHVAPLHADPISAFAHPFGGTNAAVLARGAAAGVLASTWCGTVRSTDYTASSLGSLPQFKVVYAHPA